MNRRSSTGRSDSATGAANERTNDGGDTEGGTECQNQIEDSSSSV